MSNDLISREEAINGLMKCNMLGRKSCEQVADMLRNIPTAYDVDKVVEQLSCESCEDCLLAENCIANFGDGFMEKIREIVKTGGVE